MKHEGRGDPDNDAPADRSFVTEHSVSIFRGDYQGGEK